MKIIRKVPVLAVLFLIVSMMCVESWLDMGRQQECIWIDGEDVLI